MPETPIGGAHSDSNGDKIESIDDIVNQPEPPPLPELCARVHEKVEAFLNAEPESDKIRAVQKQSRASLGIIEGALSSYSLDELSLSYNGGKDCLVLLILYLSALHSHYARPNNLNSVNHTTTAAARTPPTHALPQSLNSVYIISKHPFQAVDDFVTDSIPRYHLSLASYAKPMKEAFTDYLHDHPQIRAIFVGTRRTDPHGAHLQHFDRTDRGWPDFMRVHPVIDWHYAEIWTFIRALRVPYCGLYDLGYTSLGGTTDTHPNPALRYCHGTEGEDGDGDEERFRPAYELVEDEEERLGRDWEAVYLKDEKTIV